MSTINEHVVPLISSSNETNGRANTRKLRTTINDLPDELLLEIIEYITSMQDKFLEAYDIITLALINRRFLRIMCEKSREQFKCTGRRDHDFRAFVSNP
jgi:hypothetical protein